MARSRSFLGCFLLRLKKEKQNATLPEWDLKGKPFTSPSASKAIDKSINVPGSTHGHIPAALHAGRPSLLLSALAGL